MTDAWNWWSRAIESPKEIGQPHLPVSADNPEQGFYKTRWPGKPWEPVAIWKEGDDWVALRSGKPVDAAEVWNWCCRYPITTEAYQMALDEGRWAGDDPTVVEMLGHNIGDTDDLTTLADQIESAKQGAEAYRDIQSEEEAGKAQSLRARMNELAGQADKIREKLKKPHFEAGKKIDADWMPLVKEAKAVADQLRKFIEAFKTEQLRQLRLLEERRRRAEQARLEDEARLREEIRAAEAAGMTPVIPPAPEPLPPPPPPITDTTVKGNYGRAANVGTEMIVTAITDQDALYQYLRKNEALKLFMLDLAQKAVRAGQPVPGVEVEERAKIS